MQSYTPRQTTTPSVSSVTFPDGSRQVSARVFDDMHIRKKLKTDQKAEFMQDVEIYGPLHIHGILTTDSGTIDSETQHYVDVEMDKIFALIGWNNETSKWITSNTSNGAHHNLDYRITTFTNDHYTKDQTDSRIQSSSTLAILYYTGTSDRIVLAGTAPPVITTPTTAIPAGNTFVIPEGIGTNHFYIQNSAYGTGKVLTSDAYGKATWQTPNTQITTPESISTSLGQTTLASFYVKDLAPREFGFIPNAAPQSTAIQKAGDYTLVMTDATYGLTLTSGYGVNIVRPAGIRMSSDANGTLELYGGWAYDQTYSTAWLINSGNYTGTYIQNTFRMDSLGIHMTHNHEQAIRLYGKVELYALGIGSPAYRKNAQSTPCQLVVNGALTTDTFKLTTGAVMGKVLTCLDSAGNVAWQNTQATSDQTNFSAENVIFNNITSNGSVTTDQIIVGVNSLRTDPTATFNVTFLHPPYQLNDIWLADGQAISSNDIVRNQKIYSQPKLLDYYDIQVGPNFLNGIEIICPISIQDHWKYKNRLNQGNENKKTNMIYAIEQFKWFVYDLDENMVISNNTIDTLNETEMGAVFVQIERRRDAWYTDFNLMTSDDNAVYLYTQTMLIDKPKVTFFPPKHSIQKNYRISAEIIFSYKLQLGETLVNYFVNNGTTYYFPRMLIGGGTTAFTLTYPFPTQPTPQTSLTTLPELTLKQYQPFDGNGNFIGETQINQTPRYSCIWFLFGNKPKHYLRYEQYRNASTGNHEHCKLNKQRTHYSPDGPSEYLNNTLVNTCVTYGFGGLAGGFTSEMNPNAFITNPANTISIGDVNVFKLNVAQQIHCFGSIYCNGIGGRRGVNTLPAAMVNHSSSKNRTNIQYNSIFNFFWNEEDEYQIWVDTTLIYVGQPNWSDYRIKGNVHELVLENNDEDDSNEYNSFVYRLAKVPIFIYDLNNPQLKVQSQQHIGCFAHVLQSTFVELPHLVHGSKDAEENGEPKYQHVNYNELTMVLFKAIQELHHEQLSLAKKLDDLNSRITCVRNVCVILFLLVLLGAIYVLK